MNQSEMIDFFVFQIKSQKGGIIIKSIKKELEIEESLKQGEKDKIINFIEKVDKTNNEYQNIQELSITLTNIDEELKYNRKQINILT